MTADVDQAKLDEFMHRMIGFMTGSAVCYGIWLGDELGLYRVLADGGPAPAEVIAARAGYHPRLVQRPGRGESHPTSTAR